MLPRRINILLCLILFVFCSQNCEAQIIDTSFKLLWYKGKKLNDTTVFIPSGQTVSYKPSKGKVEVNTPPKQDVLIALTKELKRIDQRKTELARFITGSPKGPLQAGFVYHLNKSIDEVNSRYEKLGQNSIELAVENGRGGSNSSTKEIPPLILSAYNEVLNFIEDQSPITESPSPPSKGFDYCYPCDKDRQATFKRDSVVFMKWTEKERENLARAMQVIAYFGYRKANRLSYDSSAARSMEQEMFDAFQKIMDRLGKKLLQVWNKYQDDETKLPFITQLMFEFLRANQLMGLSTSNFPGALEVAAKSVDAGMRFLAKAKSERDYKVLLNIRWIVSLFRTAELLGMDPQKFEHSFLDFLKINQFKVYVDARGKISQEGTVMAAVMTGENIFGAIPDSNCVLKWTLLSPDDQKMKFHLDEVKMKTPDVTAAYTGTRNWKSYPASLQLDFCNEQKDTALLHGFFPLDGEESWNIQGQTISPSKTVYAIYSTCFMDVKRMEAMANDPALQAKMEQQMKEKYEQFMAANQGAKDPSKMTPQQIEKMNEAMLAARDITNIIQSVSTYSFICKERLRNKQKIVFDAQVNGKELSPDNPAIEEAILKLKIEHVED